MQRCEYFSDGKHAVMHEHAGMSENAAIREYAAMREYAVMSKHISFFYVLLCRGC
jgi:hypothetical protein